MKARLLSMLAVVVLSMVSWAPPAAADPIIKVGPPPGLSFWIFGVTTTRNPDNLTIEPVPDSDDHLLEWVPPYSLDDETLAGYTVYRIPNTALFDPVQHYSVGPAVTEFTDTEALPGVEYVYFVTAVYDGEGLPFTGRTESVPSNIVSTVETDYPPCSVTSIYTHWPYVDLHAECLIP